MRVTPPMLRTVFNDLGQTRRLQFPWLALVSVIGLRNRTLLAYGSLRPIVDLASPVGALMFPHVDGNGHVCVEAWISGEWDNDRLHEEQLGFFWNTSVEGDLPCHPRVPSKGLLPLATHLRRWAFHGGVMCTPPVLRS